MIIGFMGKAKSGKDTACRYVSSNCDNVVSISFAYKLKKICIDMVCESYGVPEKAFLGRHEDKERDLTIYGLPGWTGRKILQFVGNDCFKTISKDMWTKRTEVHARGLLAENSETNIVISDVRFQVEVDAIHRLGGVVVRLTRDPDADSQHEYNKHASELEMDGVEADYIIDNANVSIERFHEQLGAMLRLMSAISDED